MRGKAKPDPGPQPLRGAIARAEAEGRKMLDTLVRQGEHLQQLTKQTAADAASAAQGAAAAKAKELTEMAGGTWDRLEQVFEDRVARALARLGVFTAADFRRLSDRVDALQAAVDQLRGAAKAKAPKPAKASRGRKSAAKKAARRA